MSSQPSSHFFTGLGFQASNVTSQQWSFQSTVEESPMPSENMKSIPRLVIEHEYQGHMLSSWHKQALLSIRNLNGTPWLTLENYTANIELANLFRHTPVEDWTDMVQYLVQNVTTVGIFPWNLPENDKYIHTHELRLASRGSKVSGIPWDQPCRVCKKKEVRYVRQQLRSPDEPETTFYRCHACGANWKDSC